MSDKQNHAFLYYITIRLNARDTPFPYIELLFSYSDLWDKKDKKDRKDSFSCY